MRYLFFELFHISNLFRNLTLPCSFNVPLMSLLRKIIFLQLLPNYIKLYIFRIVQSQKFLKIILQHINLIHFVFIIYWWTWFTRWTCCIWGEENRQITHEKRLQPQWVGAWCALLLDVGICRKFFFLYKCHSNN